jgi:hypothetical protein
VLEIPMMAAGQVQGLLVLTREGARHGSDIAEENAGVRNLGHALADSMSLALSNIALRDRLRTQSLRDPLTGLYNRRYMEDTLERFLALSNRSGSSTAVIMIDLDNFKSLNDQHGHAKGDSVLRDASAQVMARCGPPMWSAAMVARKSSPSCPIARSTMPPPRPNRSACASSRSATCTAARSAPRSAWQPCPKPPCAARS